MSQSERELVSLMSQAEALRSIPVEGCFEWFDDMIPKANKLFQQLQQMQMSLAQVISTEMFNQSRECCNTLDQYIRQLHKLREQLDDKKNFIIRSQMNRMAIYDGAYSSLRGFMGK